MTRKLYLGMAALVVFGMVTAAQAVEPVHVADVEQVSTMNISTQFASMQAELDSLRAQIHEVSYGGGGQGDCGTCGSVGCNCFCDIGCGGWFAGAEAVIVKPFSQSGTEVDTDEGSGASQTFDATYDYKVTPRFWVGYRNCEGLGVRARWWSFDQNTGLQEVGDLTDTVDVSFESHALDVTALDLEATQLVCWGPLQMNFAAGVRYGKVESTGFDVDVTNDNGSNGSISSSDFEGFGPTLAMEARRPFGCRGLALIGNARSSLLFGDAKVFDADADAGFNNPDFDHSEYQDKIVYVLESQVGVEYSRCLGNGIISLRGLMEGQMWAHSFGGPEFERGSFPVHSMGFFGATIGAEYSR